jgi:hypothetical protein
MRLVSEVSGRDRWVRLVGKAVREAGVGETYG